MIAQLSFGLILRSHTLHYHDTQSIHNTMESHLFEYDTLGRPFRFLQTGAILEDLMEQAQQIALSKLDDEGFPMLYDRTRWWRGPGIQYAGKSQMLYYDRSKKRFGTYIAVQSGDEDGYDIALVTFNNRGHKAVNVRWAFVEHDKDSLMYDVTPSGMTQLL